MLDLALGVEQHFLEKHPVAISSLAFMEDKVLMSGSIDGRVNIVDLESDNANKILTCQNCQDRRIPIARVITSDFGIGAALDVEGNCRLYDLHRLRKICKVTANMPDVAG